MMDDITSEELPQSSSDTKCPPEDTLNASNANATSSIPRRRCWHEAFSSSSSGSETVTPEPGDLPMENVEEVDMCSSTTGGPAKSSDEKTSIVCEAHPGCFKKFTSVREYEDHYNLRHRHKCITCKKSLPSAHILELHVLEAHDTLFSLMAERKPMLACFLESCTSTFWKVEERKDHCLSEHKFPKSFKLWDLIATSSGKHDKKSGAKQNGKGKSAQNDKTKPKAQTSVENKDKEQMQVESTSTISNEVSSSTAAPVPSGLPNETMEIDVLVVQKKTQPKSPKSKQGSSDKRKNKDKQIPVQITFGHSASRVFQPKYGFGLAKPVPEGRSTAASKMDMDLSDIKDVLPTTTVTSVSATNQ